jgi:hypothetical protein
VECKLVINSNDMPLEILYSILKCNQALVPFWRAGQMNCPNFVFPGNPYMLTMNKDTTRFRSDTRLKLLSSPATSLLGKRESELQPFRLRKASASRAAQSTRGQALRYSISATGTTYFGNTSFPTSNTSYTPATNFRLPGSLLIESTLPAQNSTSRNGINARDVMLLIGNDASITTAGTMRYSTNTWGHRFWQGLTTGRPAIDTAVVNVNNQAGMVDIAVDPQWSRNDTSNIFCWKSSLTNSPKQVLVGNISLRVTNGGRNVTGSATLFGNGIIESAAYAYTVSFSGSLFQ